MKIYLVLLLGLTLSLVSHLGHASTQVEKFRKINVPSLKCKDMQAEFEKLQSGDKSELKKENLTVALKQLRSFPSTSNTDVETEIAALKSNVEDILPDYISLVGSGCPTVRLQLSRSIIDIALGKGVTTKEKKDAGKQLKESIVAVRHPTSLVAMQKHYDHKAWT